MSIKHQLLCTTIVLSTVAGGNAYAQSAAQTQVDTPSAGATLATAPGSTSGTASGASPGAVAARPGVADVVVVAAKRRQNLQKVALTVTALPPAAIDRRGVKELTDISKIAPEVNIQPGTFSNVQIRGIRTGAYGPTTESPNAVDLDGVYLSRFTGLNGFFFDLDHVEVLDGPQGTLYGRNAAGGVINIITHKPDPNLGGHLSIEYGNYNTLTTTAAINVPITDTLAVRGAYYHTGHDGYANNGLDDEDINSVRGSALWRPTTADRILLTLDDETLGGRGQAPASIVDVFHNPTIVTNGVNGGVCHASRTAPPGSPAPYLCTVPAGTPGGVVVPIQFDASNPRNQLASYGSENLYRQNTRSAGAMLQVDHDFGFATATGQFSYRNSYTNNNTGESFGDPQNPALITSAPTVLGIGNGSAGGGIIAKSSWTAEELRLASPSNQPLIYTVGLYHFNEDAYDGHNYNLLAMYPNTSAATVGQVIVSPDPIIPNAALPAGQGINTDFINAVGKDDAYAAFGQATYSPPILPALHFTGGLRLNYEQKIGQGSEVLNGAVNTSAVFDQTADFRAITYKGNVSYDITPRSLVYADISTGFKAGGFAYGQTPEYQPEDITAYEIGTKNRFFENRLQVNASAFHYDYKDYTATVFNFYFDTVAGHPAAVLNVTNAPAATVDGQTITVTAYATPNDLISFNGTHLDTNFSKFDISGLQAFALSAGFVPGATAATFNYAGTSIPGAPDFAFTSTYDHTFNLPRGTLDAEVDVNYVGSFLSVSAAKIDHNNYQLLGKYATADASLRYKPLNAPWSVTGYVRNMFDHLNVLTQNYVSNAVYLPAAQSLYAYRTQTFGPPRTFGFIAEYDF